MVVDSGSVESHRLYLARCTALEMLRDRGYAISVNEMDQTLAEFRSLYGQAPDLEKLKISSVLLRDPSQKIIVIFLGTEQVKLPVLRDIATQYGNENWSRMILVLRSKISSKAQENMKLLFPYKVETFQITELLINIKAYFEAKSRTFISGGKAEALKEV